MRPLALLLLALALAGCASDDDPAPPAPPDAADVGLLDGGVKAFEAYVADQRGTPVVANKWASWCGPCRAEFPWLGSQARKRKGEVAFVGVNSDDNDANAREFLADHPVPFDHFKDPDSAVAASFDGVQGFPVTVYYDSRGRREYVHYGAYASEAKLAEDIDRYAR